MGRASNHLVLLRGLVVVALVGGGVLVLAVLLLVAVLRRDGVRLRLVVLVDRRLKR